jgi:hypothetical protein
VQLHAENIRRIVVVSTGFLSTTVDRIQVYGGWIRLVRVLKNPVPYPYSPYSQSSRAVSVEEGEADDVEALRIATTEHE